VRFHKCTLAAKNQAQVAVAQAQEQAQAAEAEEARNRIRLNWLRFEVQAAQEGDMAQLEDEEVGDVESMGSLDNDGTN
jgi:multidrug resistance efflux pump